MSVNDFMERLQDYYGPYKEGTKVGAYVKKYIETEMDESKLPNLFKFITYSHGHRFGPPGISDIEEAIKEALKTGKGIDIHKTKIKEYEEKEIPVEELEEGKRLLEEAGGLGGLFKKAIGDKNIRHGGEI